MLGRIAGHKDGANTAVKYSIEANIKYFMICDRCILNNVILLQLPVTTTMVRFATMATPQPQAWVAPKIEL